MSDKADLLGIVEEEIRRHPGMGSEDLRKLIAQSAFGGDHLLADRGRFRSDLRREWNAISGDPTGGAVIQLIDPEGRTARLHLAPCKARGIEVDGLADLLSLQPLKSGSRAAYLARWSEVVAMAAQGRIPFDPDALSDLAKLEEFPHHGGKYGFASYRIVNDLTEVAVAARLRSWGFL